MINRVVVAAAGQGTRMLHLTNNKPKHLINVRQRPFLAYLLDNLFEAGYQEVILVVGYKEELMKEFLKNYKAPGPKKFKIELVSQYEILGPKEKEYGTACPIKCVRNFVDDEPFVFLCGDNLYSVKDLKAMRIDDNYNYIAGLEHKNPSKYGVLITDDGFLKEIKEKPKEFYGNLINAGLYKFMPEVFDKISQIKKSPRGEYEITDVISLLAKDKKVKIKKIEDYWIDFGCPADVIRLSNFIKNGYHKIVSKIGK
jgi:UDP-N-acetylglucosamine diphosphorylase / glucose-1-phosphate thymidylyltransferase / UDP-N-acetylgalactosamine diphosphorylase / glucosamine-1-phosphate N-acetyltransferase / galactosamine-1-phosphate N-acetyltransferase